MKPRLVAIVAAIVLAVAGGAIVFTYAQGAEGRAMARLQPVQVLVAAEAVPAGTPSEALVESLTRTTLPAAAVPPSALRDLADAAGTVTAVDLVPGETLVRERLVDPADLATPGSAPVPEGMQEVTFSLDPQRVVGGRIGAGDTVGVFVSFDSGALPEQPSEPSTQRVFHKVLVTGVQRADPATEGGADPQALPSGSLLVTVALEDADAATIIFSAEFGRIWLSKEPAPAIEGDPTTIRKSEVYP